MMGKSFTTGMAQGAAKQMKSRGLRGRMRGDRKSDPKTEQIKKSSCCISKCKSRSSKKWCI